MNILTQLLVSVYSRMLDLYPPSFRDEFAEEMQVVFSDSVHESSRAGIVSLTILCLRELGGLPFNILREFRHELGRKETIMVTNETMEPASMPSIKASHWEAFLSALPFALFGIASILSRTHYPFNAYSYLAFYAVVLLGLLIGMIKGFPRWAYSYLGWCLVFAWWWTDMYTNGLRIFGYTMGNDGWGWRIWYPLLITIAIVILWTRSFRPIRQMVTGIWQDWTLLSLAIYAFVAFASLIYDENHHPYLFAFIAATTIVICLAVWGFLKSDSSWKRVVSLLAGFVTTLVLSNISYLNNMSYATRDYAAYLGLPPSPPQPWYTAFDGVSGWTLIYSGIMYWPVVIGLVRHFINNRQKPVMPA
jgi:hypothetical protein